MAISIKHAFVSAKGDGTDATLVRPSNWNAAHTTSMATLQLLGRLSGGVGSFEELPTSAYIIAALAATDGPSFLAALGLGAFSPGDVKWTFANAAPAGWMLVVAGGTIGDATSGATLRANADVSALYTVVWNSVPDAQAPVTGGRGANAAADFAAHKPMSLPQLVGRSPIGAGAAAGVTTIKNIGTLYGEENHTLTAAELAAHSHPNSLNDPTHAHVYLTATYNTNQWNPGGGANPSSYGLGGATTNAASTGMSITNANNTGAGGAHNNIPAVVALNAMVKL